MTARLDMALVSFEDVSDIGDEPLSAEARLLWVQMVTWSCLNSTDGDVRTRAMRQVTDLPKPEASLAALVDAGRLAATAGGWHIVGFEDRQLDSGYKSRERKRGADRQKAWREKRLGSGSGANSPASSGATNGATNGVTHPATNGVSNDGLSLAKRSEAKLGQAKAARSASPALRSGSAALAQHREEAETLAQELDVSIEGNRDSDLTNEQAAEAGYCEVCGLLARHEDLIPVYLSVDGSEVDGLVHRGDCIEHPLVVEVID